ncbi:hypothetical protein AbraIFM66951_003612 [Aspergillus brasiliensis]|uniref:Metallo-beta-lactamase domain-containing protein n=1 Tax=Aspergillus brasiliensis TaxID=319629 RepID=A0A9W5Z1B1_9EURO|nr:hypothetical protein AbraCBS73388_002365 [Aspergillus brasiliensis]GKZ50475.1 hypothetical protein AbraIFM66951_003612 [Aspergillus brasiliensis]
MASLSLPAYKGSTADVSIIHAGQTSVPTAYVFKTPIPGHDTLDIPCYSFLIENKRNNEKVLFDLGLRKDWKEKLPPAILNQIESSKAVLDIEHDVVDQLRADGNSLDSISAIIWSHHHIDHTGDPSLFPPSTKLVVGPGFKSHATTFPGYPSNVDALVTDDAFNGRDLVELDFTDSIDIGGFLAVDFFHDGSLYLLRSNGHTHNHISALARTSEHSFIFLGGDIAHHPGEFRPTKHLPLPSEISLWPVGPQSTHAASVCPAAVFEAISPAKDRGLDAKVTPFYELNAAMNESLEDAEVSLERMMEFDASCEVWVIIAHDASLQDVLPFFPKRLTDGDVEGYKENSTWRFLRDIPVAIDGSAE